MTVFRKKIPYMLNINLKKNIDKPFSLHLAQSDVDLGFFLRQKSFLNLRLDTTQQERPQNL